MLEAHYFALRGKLFDDLQASIVEAQENGVADQLGAADRVLATFKREHDIANFAERQKILLAQQGRLEDELKKTDSTVTGLQARVAELGQQLKLVSGQKGDNADPNAAAAMQSAVEAFRRRENEAATTYRGSPAVDTARMEMLKSQAELGKLQTSNAYLTEQELNKAQADLRTNAASRDTIKAQLDSTNAELASIGADETRLHQLERAGRFWRISIAAWGKFWTSVASSTRSTRTVERPCVSSRRRLSRPRRCRHAALYSWRALSWRAFSDF